MLNLGRVMPVAALDKVYKYVVRDMVDCIIAAVPVEYSSKNAGAGPFRWMKRIRLETLYPLGYILHNLVGIFHIQPRSSICSYSDSNAQLIAPGCLSGAQL